MRAVRRRVRNDNSGLGLRVGPHVDAVEELGISGGPFTSGTPPIPPDPSFMLMETGDFLLLESGDKILLET